MRKISLENINDLTGIILLLCGISNLITQEWEMALSWTIFGCMYLVMDGYYKNNPTYTRKLYFGYAGFIFSILLLIYYII